MKTSRRAFWQSSVWKAFKFGLSIQSGRRLRSAGKNTRAFCEADPDRAGSRPWRPASLSPRRVEARNRITKTESLKCTARRAAYCRLSVKPSSFRLSELPSCSCSLNQRNTNETSTTVADDCLPPVGSPSNCRRVREHPAYEFEGSARFLRKPKRLLDCQRFTSVCIRASNCELPQRLS